MEIKFKNLNDLYDYIEKNAWNYEHYQIGKLFFDYKNSLKSKDLSGKKAQWEVDFFYFDTFMGKIIPARTKTSKDGTKHNFPDLENFDNDTYNYLIHRLDTSKNLLLKARYSIILWNSPKKHRKYAEIAVDSYLRLVTLYEKKDLKEPNKNYGFKIVKSIKNAYIIAVSSKYNVAKVKSEIKRLIHQFNYNSNNSFYLRTDLIQLMLNDKKNFIKADFSGMEDILWKLAEMSIFEKDYNKTIKILEFGKKVENKLNTKKFPWEQTIGESYESLMEEADKKDNDARIHYCENALKHYKNLKNEIKISELEKKYIEFKSSMKLLKRETTIDLTNTIDRCHEIAHDLITNHSTEIIPYLMLDKNILPNLKDVEKFVDEEMLKHFSSRVPRSVLDHNGHVMQHFSEADELRYYQILAHFKRIIEFNTVNLLNIVIIKAITANKLSYDILINFFIQKSWIGKTFEKEIQDGKIIRKNWLDLISPALWEYFDIINLYLLDPTYEPNFVLIIDSLTLKLEGLLRDICQNFLGISTFYQKQDKGRNIAREKDINMLLRINELKSFFNDEEILFFKFLLVEKAGYNLRHKIAHSLADDKEYQMGMFHLILLALLRLGKYNLNIIKEESVKEESVKENKFGEKNLVNKKPKVTNPNNKILRKSNLNKKKVKKNYYVKKCENQLLRRKWA